MKRLTDPVKIGAWELSNRIVMAPLTRTRADDRRVPNPLMVEYYAQRATAGLIISEATSVSPMGVGYPNTPGIWSREQVEGWREVTDAVHAKGGKIILQLWHVGRISHTSYLNGASPLAPSAIAADGHVSLVRPLSNYETPRALETEEMPSILAAFFKGAEHAKLAGFDGVEIHGANGYLLDQFLQDSTNKRTDSYGGSIENRARLMLEVTDAVVAEWGADRVGMHLAPRCDAHDMGDSDPSAIFGYVAEELGKRKLAFICTREAQGDDSLSPMMKEKFGGAYIANEGLTPKSAEALVSDGAADAVAFGKLFIANPDLVERIASGAKLNEWDDETFYADGAKGYTDYPTLDGASA